MSLKETALIVSVNINQPTKARTDKKAIAEVARKFGVKENNLDLRKRLYPKHLTEPFESVATRARAYVKANGTYPWQRGEDLLPSDKFMEFAEGAGKIELEWSQAVTAFLNNWANVQLQAQGELQALYEAGLYPSLEELAKQFSLKFRYRPITDDSDYRVKCSEEAEVQIKQQAKDEYMENSATLRALPLTLLQDKIQKLLDKLNEPDREIKDEHGTLIEMRPSIFRDSTVDNIVTECDKIIDFGPSVLGTTIVDVGSTVKIKLPTAKNIRADRQAARDLCNKFIDLIALTRNPEIQRTVIAPEQQEQTVPVTHSALQGPNHDAPQGPNPTGLEPTPEQIAVHDAEAAVAAAFGDDMPPPVAEVTPVEFDPTSEVTQLPTQQDKEETEETVEGPAVDKSIMDEIDDMFG